MNTGDKWDFLFVYFLVHIARIYKYELDFIRNFNIWQNTFAPKTIRTIMWLKLKIMVLVLIGGIVIKYIRF